MPLSTPTANSVNKSASTFPDLPQAVSDRAGNKIAKDDSDTMTPISAIEKWKENLGRIVDENSAKAAASAAAEQSWRAADRARVGNGKAVRRVCAELSDSEDVRMIREYVAQRNACKRASNDRPHEKVVVTISERKGIDPDSIYRHGRQMVVNEDGIRILRLGFSYDVAKRPTWFQRRDTELFDPAELRARVRAAADSIRRGDDPTIEYHCN